jgi:signal transduction histidine kinase/FixJ family two-component response regulator/HPt (histidine-containing phosphotransfer) domain-containing protein
MSRPPLAIVPLRRRRSAMLDKYSLGSVLGIVAILVLAVLTGIATYRSILAQRADTEARVNTALTNQTMALSEEINRQFLAVDQTLRILARGWETDPAAFKLEDRRADATVLSGLNRDMILVDENGIIRQASVPEAVGQNVAARDFIVYARKHPTPFDGIFIGGASIDPVMRQWHLNVAIWLHRPDGSFAGAIAADYRVSALLDVFHQAFVGNDGLVGLIGLADGRVRANLSATVVDPNTDYSATPMVAAMTAHAAGLWFGKSATDAVERFHAYRRLPVSDLILIVAMEQEEAMRPATEWQWQSARFAGAILLLLLIMGWQLLHGAGLARSHGHAQAADHAMLAATNAQLQVAKAEADAKAEQLEATLGGMTDGIYMMDAQFCLVEWNARFPDLAGIPPELPRVGLPMEEILRAQANSGLFGEVDTEAEVARRMAVLRNLQFGTTERTRPDGRTIELRRRELPDGGFVTLYSDITEHKRVEAALREARATAEAANAAKSRFVAIVSHEIRTPLNALLNTLRLLADSVLTASQRGLVNMASQSGDALSSLINDILEMSRMEAGQLALRPSTFELRPMLEGAIEIFQGQAEARGMRMVLAIGGDVPPMVMLDGGRLRQVLLNLLSNAVKFAHPGDVVLSVERDWTTRTTAGGLFIAVRDRGPVIAADDRTRLFQPFSRLDRPEGDQPLGTGLGLSICHHLVTLMGGAIGCEPWSDGIAAGNTFWLTLPDTAIVLPPLSPTLSTPDMTPDRGAMDLPRRGPPRTRILVVEDVRANQVIAATLLRRVGHAVDIACDGAAAIEAVQRKPYDVVLMDNFMPGMSGQEATRHIRELAGVAGQVPILALTANTAPEDAVLFIAAGMNGVLGKPVSLPELQAALTRFVWFGHPAGGVTTARAAAAPDDDKSILALERVAELRTNLPADVLASLVDACLTDLEEKMLPFRRALASGAPFEIESQAHTIAGVAAGYGLAALEAKARAIMAAAKADDAKGFDTAFAETEAELARGGAALRNVVQKQVG